ncbi:MAG: hypothetical protein ACTHJP_10800 [Rhodanobacteraceae bacterium]
MAARLASAACAEGDVAEAIIRKALRAGLGRGWTRRPPKHPSMRARKPCT